MIPLLTFSFLVPQLCIITQHISQKNLGSMLKTSSPSSLLPFSIYHQFVTIWCPKCLSNGFKNILVEQLNKVNEKQIEADILTEKMIRGDSDVSIHEVMLAGEEANMSLQLAVQVRNKLLEAFQEISRTQI